MDGDIETLHAQVDSAMSWFNVHVRPECACCDICGDVNHSGGDPNVADLAFLVDYLFRGGTVPCADEADVNADDTVTVSDLSYLVDFLFRGGPAPIPCG
jgi:hypothetical protein